MKKLSLKKIIMIFFIGNLFLNGLVYAESSEENEVCFKFVNIHGLASNLSIEYFSQYTPTGKDSWYSITPNEFWGGLNRENDKCLVVSANRENSTVPVNYLKSVMNWDNKDMFDLGGSNGTPKELNFAFGLNIIFNINGNNYTCSHFMLGQGSDKAGINDWWIFMNNNYRDRSLICVDEQGVAIKLFVSETGTAITNHHTFSLSF